MADRMLAVGRIVLLDKMESNGLVWTGLDGKPDATLDGSQKLILNKDDDDLRVVVDTFVDWFDQKVYGRAYHVKTGGIRWYLITKSTNG